MIGKLDAILDQLTIINRSKHEMQELEKMKKSFMRLRSNLGISVTTKAHLINDHIVDQTRSLYGIGVNKAKHHIEKNHQESNHGLTVTRTIKNFSDHTHTQLRNVKNVNMPTSSVRSKK